MSQIRVKATAKGYDGFKYRNPGDEFEVDEKKFSETWMESLDPKGVPAKAAAPTKTDTAPTDTVTPNKKKGGKAKKTDVI